MGDELQKQVEEIMARRNEIIDLFVKTFIATEVKDIEHFKSGSLELVIRTSSVGMNVGETYTCAFIDLEEKAALKKKLTRENVIREAESAMLIKAIEKLEKMGEEKCPHTEYEAVCCVHDYDDAIEALKSLESEKGK